MTINPVVNIAAQLKGQVLRCPDLTPSFSQWPSGVSPHYKQLEATVERRIREWIPDQQIARSARNLDLAYFVATWWPKASVENLETMAWMTLWLFIWDDFVEDAAMPDSLSAEGKVEWLHHQAFSYVESELGLSESSQPAKSPTKYCSLFKYAAVGLRDNCSVAVRRQFCDAFRYYMACCETEEVYTRSGAVPDIETYWKHRVGSSGMDMYIVLQEFMAGSNIPEHLHETPEIKRAQFELGYHIVALNDIFSLKKELSKNWLGAIPILIKENDLDLEGAVAYILDIAKGIERSFDRAAEALLEMVEHDPAAHVSVQDHVDIMRTNMTGNYVWSWLCTDFSAPGMAWRNMCSRMGAWLCLFKGRVH
ncbi:isoprenoid synthase domain-containing protein [Podospora appendiculata]|uniref:Terpene synthase n=1 Tax=Podospora appendiculata TaxID=314037 RepID=A0AAE1CG53_9PEZI|nr:isoprenoid synthase domain-containing protein [Podospora appendiculata]